jgi:hypothetical protein
MSHDRGFPPHLENLSLPKIPCGHGRFSSGTTSVVPQGLAAAEDPLRPQSLFVRARLQSCRKVLSLPKIPAAAVAFRQGTTSVVPQGRPDQSGFSR